ACGSTVPEGTGPVIIRTRSVIPFCGTPLPVIVTEPSKTPPGWDVPRMVIVWLAPGASTIPDGEMLKKFPVRAKFTLASEVPILAIVKLSVDAAPPLGCTRPFGPVTTTTSGPPANAELATRNSNGVRSVFFDFLHKAEKTRRPREKI